MQNNGFMAGFNKISELIMRFAGTNLLWFLFNIPIVFLGLSLFAMENANEVYTIIITIAFLTPLVFFPATTAMFGVLRKFVMDEEVPIIRIFLKYYKENYLRSMIGGIFIVFLWIILTYYYVILLNISQLFGVIFIILLVVLLMFTLNFFSMTVHMETRLFAAFKSSFLITISSPILTIGVSVISVVIIYISFNVFTFLIPFFVGSVIAHIAFSGFYKVMSNFQALKEAQEETVK